MKGGGGAGLFNRRSVISPIRIDSESSIFAIFIEQPYDSVYRANFYKSNKV